MRLSHVLVPLLALGAAACERQPCYDALVQEIEVDLTDLDGDPIDDASVVYSVEGGPAEPCDYEGDATYVCGPYVAGLITVTASYQGRSDAVTFEVDEDTCELYPEHATLVLE